MNEIGLVILHNECKNNKIIINIKLKETENKLNKKKAKKNINLEFYYDNYLVIIIIMYVYKKNHQYLNMRNAKFERFKLQRK